MRPWIEKPFCWWRYESIRSCFMRLIEGWVELGGVGAWKVKFCIGFQRHNHNGSVVDNARENCLRGILNHIWKVLFRISIHDLFASVLVGYPFYGLKKTLWLVLVLAFFWHLWGNKMIAFLGMHPLPLSTIWIGFFLLLSFGVKISTLIALYSLSFFHLQLEFFLITCITPSFHLKFSFFKTKIHFLQKETKELCPHWDLWEGFDHGVKTMSSLFS